MITQHLKSKFHPNTRIFQTANISQLACPMQTIFITGAASGIGRATAIHFHQQGWFVGLFDVQEDALQSLATELGSRCILAKVDVRDRNSIQAAMRAFSNATSGTMNVLFNCAGVLRMGDFDEILPEDNDLMVDVNVKGMINCCYEALPMLKTTNNSRVINMCSASALYGTPEMAVYSATKHAVRGLTEAWNIEFEPYDIYVCDLMPQAVNTPMVENSEKLSAGVEKMGVNLQAEDVALVVWKAAHAHKIHWKIPFLTAFLDFTSHFVPWAKRSMIKTLASRNSDK